MKKIKLSLVAVLTFSGLLFAGEDVTAIEETPVMVDSGAFYIGLGYSYIMSNRTATHNTPGEIDHGETARNIDSSAHAMLLQIGYQFNQYIAIEGRYTFTMSDMTLQDNINDNSEWKDNIDLSNIALYLKPMYPIGDFSIYGLLGYGKVERKDKDDSRGNWDDSCLQWGAGVQYVIIDNFLIFADYTLWHDSDDEAHPNAPRLVDTDFSAISLGATYKF